MNLPTGIKNLLSTKLTGENEEYIYLHKLESAIFGISTLIIICIFYHYSTVDAELKIALRGYGPQDYVNLKMLTANFLKNWHSGIMVYDYSLPMKIYYYANKYFGIDPSTLMYPHIFLQIVLFSFGMIFLANTLFQNRLISFISFVIVLLSPLPGLNLSSFGPGFSSTLGLPLFYNYAYAFLFFALAYYFRNRFIWCFVFIALTVYCHVNMGLFTLAFISAYILYRPKVFLEKSFQIGSVLFLLLVLPYGVSTTSIANLSIGTEKVNQWIILTRIFCYHWYPITMRIFTQDVQRLVLPFFLSVIFFIVSLRYHDVRLETNGKIVLGMIICLVMSCVGIIFSDLHPIPIIVRISLQRSTAFITFFAILYIIFYLIRKIEEGNIVTVFIAVYGIVVFMFSIPGIAILPLAIFLYFDIKEGQLGPFRIPSTKIKILKDLYLILLGLLIFVSLITLINGKAEESLLYQYSAALSSFFLIRGESYKFNHMFQYLILGCSLITIGIWVLKKSHKWALVVIGTIILCVGLILSVWFIKKDESIRWHNDFAKQASAYYNVQVWARKNTPVNSLFMPDPSHYYGWRDFSQRSSFGNLREWGFSSIAYNFDSKSFKEGKNRMRAFGIDIDKVTTEDIKNNVSFFYMEKYNRDIHNSYYTMSAERLHTLIDKYGIDYFVMNNDYLEPSHKIKLLETFNVAYENEYYIVFDNYIRKEPVKQETIFKSNFSNWQGLDKINMSDLNKTAAPLSILGNDGDFNFIKIPNKNGNTIRVYPVKKGKTGDLVIFFGYWLNNNGFDVSLQPGQNIYFEISARLSHKTKKPSEIIIQDKTEGWEKREFLIDKTSWNQYFAAKKIREGMNEIVFGIYWQPDTEDEWLEIKGARIFTIN